MMKFNTIQTSKTNGILCDKTINEYLLSQTAIDDSHWITERGDVKHVIECIAHPNLGEWFNHKRIQTVGNYL